MSRKHHILVVDDEEALRKQLYWALRDDYEVVLAADRDEALARIAEHPVDLVLLDLRFPPHDTEISGGREILAEIHKVRPELPVIIMTGDQDRETAIEMVARGAFDLFRKPIHLDELRVIVKRALRMRRLESEVRQLQSKLASSFGIENMIGTGRAMQEVIRLVRKVADTSATVLIRGESGTGKELVARALHQLSSRRDAPFVALNCTAIPANLIDDELFGHEKGAFTGAVGLRQGKFEFAGEGTLFLDEVGDLPEPVQMKLLRVLQESEIQRLGGNETIAVRSRLVAATHQDLEQRCSEGSFREDFYYRLKVVSIVVPPLRERREDIPLLAEHFLAKHGEAGSPTAFAQEAIEQLSAFDWPGNVRQLENVVNALCVTAEGKVIEAGDLPDEIAGSTQPTTAGNLLAMEKEMIRQALETTKGNQTQAAKQLGITRHVLLTKLKKHGL